jgi:hypothetical protein
MVETLCRHCRTEIPYARFLNNPVGYCDTCWTQHLDGSLILDNCKVEVHGNQRVHNGKNLRHAGLTDHTSSPTWPHVEYFARRMEYKLSVNRHKGDREGWLIETPEWLFARGIVEGGEIAQLMTHCPDDRDPNWAELVADECADQANLLMMLADKVLHDYPRDKESAS